MDITLNISSPAQPWELFYAGNLIMGDFPKMENDVVCLGFS